MLEKIIIALKSTDRNLPVERTECTAFPMTAVLQGLKKNMRRLLATMAVACNECIIIKPGKALMKKVLANVAWTQLRHRGNGNRRRASFKMQHVQYDHRQEYLCCVTRLRTHPRRLMPGNRSNLTPEQ
eukprot:scaffold247999_cov32-Prasinocladus_malaysianus.AAC.1